MIRAFCAGAGAATAAFVGFVVTFAGLAVVVAKMSERIQSRVIAHAFKRSTRRPASA